MRFPLIIAVIIYVMFPVNAGFTQQKSTERGFQPINVEILANSIYRAEGGSRTKHPYGILARYKHTTPRAACINTINHAMRDWNGKGDFIDVLQVRYCPVNSDTDNGTCKYWATNVKHFYYNKGGK